MIVLAAASGTAHLHLRHDLPIRRPGSTRFHHARVQHRKGGHRGRRLQPPQQQQPGLGGGCGKLRQELGHDGEPGGRRAGGKGRVQAHVEGGAMTDGDLSGQGGLGPRG